MLTEDTIAAISTSLGYGGIGIVRLSGPEAIGIADRIFISLHTKALRHVPSHRILYGHIVNEKKEVLDEVLVSVMRGPRTYTREDVVEINCHGGPVPLRRILELVLESGARLADPGEFTRRAFLNGRIDLAQAEAVLDVIHALTERSQRVAVRQLEGGLSHSIEAIRDELIRLTALVEAHIDFPEEDMPPPSSEHMKNSAADVVRSLEGLIGGSMYGVVLREGLKTAIIGRPNVGKSSLLNALLEQDRAIVTEIPGTTRDIIEEYLNIRGTPVKIMDTAGIGKAKDLAEGEGVRRSLRAMTEADLVLLVLDGSMNLCSADRELIARADQKKTILVVNKTDLPQEISLGEADFRLVRVSALERKGLENLRDGIVAAAIDGKSACGTETVTNVRHVQALRKTLRSVNCFADGLDAGTSPEFLAVELRDALDAVGQMLGYTTPEEILDRIFKNFCIGK